jgi:alpha-L-rhamnosidase
LSLAAAVAAAALAPAAPAAAAEVAPTTLRTQDMRAPVGIDVTQPTLSWRLDGGARGAGQSAYEIRAASSAEQLAAGEADLWSSGRVASTRTSDIAWEGAPLRSRARVVWQVRTWDQRGEASGWSEPTHFELGLLERDEWAGRWIGNDRFDSGVVSRPTVLSVGAQSARYIRLDVTRLGIGAFDAPDRPHLQLAELEAIDSSAGDVNRARGATVTGSSVLNCCGWTPVALTDGVQNTNGDPKGFTSSNFDRQDENVWIQLDLGSVRSFDTIRLWPRTDARTAAGRVPNFPEDFSISASADGSVFTQVGPRLTGQTADLPQGPAGLPLFAKQFATEPGKTVARARFYLAGQGIQHATFNGSEVTDAVLQPGYTIYERRAEYATYDITRLVRDGANVVGVELASGMWDAQSPSDGRYAKLTRSGGGPRLIGQVEVDYSDGSRQTIASGTDWLTTLGPTTASWWWGGESFDARRVQAGWNEPGADRAGWVAAGDRDAGAAAVALSGMDAPPIERVQTLEPTNVIALGGGRFTVDLGVNFAGWPQISLDLPAGTTIRLRPAEKVNADGTVNQQSVRTGMWSSYTSAGSGRETWHPRFMYHGFRYLQIEGMPAGAQVTRDDVRGLVLRTANESVGSFSSCMPMLDDIHRIIDRATQSNMYSVMTDCPHREKLGWLGDHQLNLRGVEMTYDVLAHTRAVVRKMIENQYPDGFVPNIIPQYAQFGGATRNMFDDDPNWGGAIVFMPHDLWKTYGDTQTIRTAWPAMARYVGYLTGKAPTGLLDYDTLGDWFTFDGSTPKGLASTYAYARMVAQMAEMATALGKDGEAAEYRTLHDKIRGAFNVAYRRGDGVTYGSGSQASDAMALDAGLVAEGDRAAVLRHLLASIRGRGDHTDVGIVALPALFRVLAQERRDDVIVDVATVPTSPSYAYQVINGATALTEAWDGPTLDSGENSQNHFMLGAIQEWFTSGAAGIEQAPGSVGYERLVIEPAVVGELECAAATYRTPRGVVSSSWRRSRRGVLTLDLTVPGRHDRAGAAADRPRRRGRHRGRRAGRFGGGRARRDGRGRRDGRDRGDLRQLRLPRRAAGRRRSAAAGARAESAGDAGARAAAESAARQSGRAEAAAAERPRPQRPPLARPAARRDRERAREGRRAPRRPPCRRPLRRARAARRAGRDVRPARDARDGAAPQRPRRAADADAAGEGRQGRAARPHRAADGAGRARRPQIGAPARDAHAAGGDEEEVAAACAPLPRAGARAEGWRSAAAQRQQTSAAPSRRRSSGRRLAGCARG